MIYWKKDIPFYFIISLLVVLVYANTISNGYNLDDELVTKNNPTTSSKGENSLLNLFKSNYDTQVNISYGYRPVTLATFYLEHKIFGESPTVSHTLNVILFALLITLLFKVLRLVFQSTNPYVLLFITLLFAVHSAHAEVVASIKNRDEVLSLSFFLLAVWSSFSWLKNRKIHQLILTAALISLSILSKKTTLPVIFLLPCFLLFKNQLKFPQFFIFSFCCSVPLALFAFNFKLLEGSLVLFTSQLLYVSLFFTQQHIILQKWKLEKTLAYVISAAIAIGLFAFGLVGNEIVLWIAGLIVLLMFIKEYFSFSHVVIVVFSLLGYAVFQRIEILMFAIVLWSSFIFKTDISLRRQLIVVVMVFGLTGLAAVVKADAAFVLVYATPLLIFLSKKANRYLPFILSCSFIVAALIFGFLNIFLVAIFIYSLIPLIKRSNQYYLNQIITLIWVVVFSCFTMVSHFSANDTFFKSGEVAELVESSKVDKSLSNIEEGRKLEFIENTLVANHSSAQRLATGLLTLGEYLRLMIYPKELSFYYGYAKINTTDFSDLRVWTSILLHLALFLLLIFTFQKHALISVGLLWYLASIFIFSNIPVLVAGMVGERLSFTASLGFCMLIGGIINWAKPDFNFKRIKGVEVLSILVLLALGSRTFVRNQQWESATKLMSNDIKHLDNSAQANYLLAIHTVKEAERGPQVDIKKVNQSIRYFKNAIEIYPKYYNFYFDLGRAYLVASEYKLAKQNFIAANELEPNALLGLFELAKVSFTLREYAEVTRYFKLYVTQSKSNPIVYELAAYSTYYMDDFQESIRITEAGLSEFPNNEALTKLLVDLRRRMH
ncbi:MAG: hypothetical protein ACJAV5_000174 [Vicingaceae bacterium]|jgi:hypothetical protein